MRPMCHHLRGRVVAGILTLLALLLFGCAERSHGEAIDQSITTYTEILQLALDADTLQPYYQADSTGTPYPVFIIDDVLSRSEDESGLERFGQPVTFIKSDAAYLPPMEAHFKVTQYASTDSATFIQLKYNDETSSKFIYLDASYRTDGAAWQPESIRLTEQDRIPREEYLAVYEEILRMVLSNDGIQDCLTDNGKASRLPVTFAEKDFSRVAEPPSILVYGQPVKFITLEAADILGPRKNVWNLEFHYGKKAQDIRTDDGGFVKLTNTRNNSEYQVMYGRTSEGWAQRNQFGCYGYDIYASASVDSTDDESDHLPMSPEPIDGINGYGCVVTDYSEDSGICCQLVRLGKDTLHYEVLDSFSTNSTLGQCGDNTMYFVTAEDTLFHFVTIGPLPNTHRDTVVSFVEPDSGYVSLYPHFLNLEDSLFGCQLYKTRQAPSEHHQYFIGRIGEDGLADTVALLMGVIGRYLSVDSTEIYVNVLSDPDHGNRTKPNMGIYDLVAGSLLVPLDGDYYNWAPYRASRDEPLYFLRTTGQRTTNIWRWHENMGEEQLTFHKHPKQVKSGRITEDSVIYYVGAYGVLADSSNTERLAIPLEAGE